MNERRFYDLPEVTGDDYGALLQGVAPLATTIGLIIRSPLMRLTERADAVLATLQPFWLESEQVTSWPGTQLAGDRTSLRNLYQLNNESLVLLRRAATALSDWVNPQLPEDLHLLRADGSTVLGTVAQEEDAWVELTQEEVHQVAQTLPPKLQRMFSATS
jgi:hypothetical protein